MSDDRKCSMCGRKLSPLEGSVCSGCTGGIGKAVIWIVSILIAIVCFIPNLIKWFVKRGSK